MKSTIDSINRINVFWTLDTASIVLGVSPWAQIQNFLKHSCVKEKIALCRTRIYGEKLACALKKAHFQLIQVQCMPFKSYTIFMTLGWLKIWVGSIFFNFATNREINVCVWAATSPADDWKSLTKYVNSRSQTTLLELTMCFLCRQ